MTTEEFQSEVLDSSVPVIVDFYATWCMPCKMLAPILEEVAAEAGDTAKVVKVDIDQNPQLANEYGIQSVPTLVFVKDGQVADQVLGAVPKAIIMEKLGRV